MTCNYKKLLEDAAAIKKRFIKLYGRTPDYDGQKERAAKGGRPRYGETKDEANARRGARK